MKEMIDMKDRTSATEDDGSKCVNQQMLLYIKHFFVRNKGVILKLKC